MAQTYTNQEILDKILTNSDSILEKLKRPVVQYSKTLLHEGVDTGLDAYQKNFSAFYKLRFMGRDNFPSFFSLLNDNRHNSDISYIGILQNLQEITGRLEVSFASKLVATIDTKQPVIDSVLLGHLGLKVPAYNVESRLQKADDLHKALTNRLSEIMSIKDFDSIKTQFYKAYPNYAFSDTKILDLMMWQLRPKPNAN